ncbi:MAG: MFS transporter [Gammaproteobacteria bacterium]
MRKTLAGVLALLASYALLLLGNGLFNTLLGVRGHLEGFTSDTMGVVMSGHFVGLAIGSMLAVRVVSSAGHIRAFAAFASLMSIAALCHVLWIHPVAWLGLRVVTGFSMAGTLLVTESWLNARASAGMRGQLLALYMMTNYLSAGAGQFLLPLADPGEFVLFAVASIAYSLALMPLLLTRTVAPTPDPVQRASLNEMWRVSPLGLTGALGAGLIMSSFLGMGAVFCAKVGLSLTETSVFIASGVFGGLLLQWPVGRLSDRFDRRWVLTAVALVAAFASLGVIATVNGSRLLLFAAVAVYGGLATTVYSLCNAHVNDFADPAHRVRTASSLLMTYAIGACFGPLMSGQLMAHFEASALFYLTSSVLFALGLFSLYRMTRRSPISHGRFMSLAPSTQTPAPLYGRMRDEADRDLSLYAGGRWRQRNASLRR